MKTLWHKIKDKILNTNPPNVIGQGIRPTSLPPRPLHSLRRKSDSYGGIYAFCFQMESHRKIWQKTMEDELKSFGITADVVWKKHADIDDQYDPIVYFESEEDMNLYKMLGKWRGYKNLQIKST